MRNLVAARKSGCRHTACQTQIHASEETTYWNLLSPIGSGPARIIISSCASLNSGRSGFGFALVCGTSYFAIWFKRFMTAWLASSLV